MPVPCGVQGVGINIDNRLMANLKSLAKDTAIYGLSSIVGRFLN